MMHEWLNVGTQKAYMDQDDVCPCCGLEKEDQAHLYHCKHEDMIEAKEDALNTIERNLKKAHIPPGVMIAFMNSMRSAVHSTTLRKQFVCTRAWDAQEQQSTLGSFAILRGHHHVDWAHACMDTFRRPPEPPGRPEDEKKVHYKSPIEMSVSLIEQSWYLFERVWETRNNILHSDDSYAAESQNSYHFEQLLWYKRYVNRLLHDGDRHHVGYPVGDIAAWDRKRKEKDSPITRQAPQDISRGLSTAE